MGRCKQVRILYIADCDTKEASDKINEVLEKLECDPSDVRLNFLNGSDYRVAYCVITYIQEEITKISKGTDISKNKMITPVLDQNETGQCFQDAIKNLTKRYGNQVLRKEFTNLDFSEVKEYFDPCNQAYVKLGNKVVTI